MLVYIKTCQRLYMAGIFSIHLYSLLIILPFVTCNTYTDQFAIQLDGDLDKVKKFADEHDLDFLGHIVHDYYHFKHRRLSKRSVEKSIEHHKRFEEHPMVKSFSQQVLKSRCKRAIETRLNDPKWPEMWYLNRGKGLDMNVEEAWKLNVTGKGIVVTILDDGLEKDHPDISENYDALASYDINSHDDDPQPRYDFMDSNRHGTRCAGEVAASANNSECSVGIAFKAHVGGVRMLDGDVTDAVEARSLSLNSQHIDIYSASWGPDDDGKTVDGPGLLAQLAFKDGVEKGRGRLGSIFVWASGNGGREKDNCNCDGYTNSIWTLSISSATENGLVPWYSESCSSTLAATYSSGSSGEKQIVTTDLRHGCTISHTGTSASAPLAAGICALTLEANKLLTWRDMQHIVVRTANPANLFAKDWVTNGVGRNVSHSFGYGVMDAAAMVKLARSWSTVPPQQCCEVRSYFEKKHFRLNKIEESLTVECENVLFLEHVQAKITLNAGRRGNLHIYLTSPAGTKSTLLAQRPYDTSEVGFDAWPFMTVHSWGENPNGVWTLEIHYDSRYTGSAALKDWSLVLYGTTENPDVAIRNSIKIKQSDKLDTLNSKDSNHSSNITEKASLHTVPSDVIRGRKDKEPDENNNTKNDEITVQKQNSAGCIVKKGVGKCLDNVQEKTNNEHSEYLKKLFFWLFAM